MWRKTFRVTVEGPSEALFDYVADLTRHGEWSPTPLSIERVEGEGLGARYRSVGTTRGREVASQIVVTTNERPARFGFTATSPSTTFEHVFTFTPAGSQTVVERTLTRRSVIPKVRLVGLYLIPFVLVPAAREAMTLLKNRVEQSAT
jgi:hypothetical protein